MLQYADECTLWIRGSSGRLCTDLIKSSNPALFGLRDEPPVMRDLFPFSAANAEAIVIESLTLGQYHGIIYWNLGHLRSNPISTSIIVNLGAILSCPLSDRIADTVQISGWNPDIRWNHWATIQGVKGEVTNDGWTRYSYVILPR